MYKVLITGGAGFIGSYIVNQLFFQKNYEVIVLDNFSEQIHGKNYRESFLFKSIAGKCKIINGDIRDKELMSQIIIDIDYIIHLASETGTGQSMYEINRYTDVNIMGISNIFEALLSKRHKIKKIILSSSRSVYGEGMYNCGQHDVVFPKSRDVEDMLKGDYSVKCPICHEPVELIKTSEECLLSPVSYYAYTKMAQEKMLETMCPILNIPFTIFRYQNVYGAGQSLSNPYTGILSIFSKILLKNATINVFEDGEESRDFIHVKDVASITCNALINPNTNDSIINVGSGENVSVLNVALTLRELYSSNSEIKITGDFRKGDIRHNIADINRARILCDFIPKYTFNKGIEEFSKWVISETVNSLNDDLYTISIEEMKEKGMLIKKI